MLITIEIYITLEYAYLIHTNCTLDFNMCVVKVIYMSNQALLQVSYREE